MSGTCAVKSPRTPTRRADQAAMPREGAIIFSDLIGKLDAVRITCPS
jgi:hypothetical protein